MSGEIQEYIIHVLINDFNLPIVQAAVTDDTPLGPAGLNLESLSFVELAYRLEDRFGIVIPDEDYEKIATFTTGQLVGYLERRRPPAEATV